ncbi:MAG: cysteine desulfurase family protein [Lachnospiraceae bacterium]|nr:cysteine desulfurase family protein [Lachnospiraceae bacterium]
MEAYFDNSATTKCYDEVKDIVMKTMMEDYGNPSAMHQKGVEAEQYIKEATERIAKTLKASEKEIYFTSGGTESNNWALMGAAMANRRAGKRIITTVIEHPAVSEPVRFLEEQGFDVVRLSVDRQGLVSMEELEQALTPETIVVSTMFVNNEIGAVEPVEAIGKLVHEKCPKALYHVDAIQAYGKYEIYPKKMNIDLMSVSGHKIHGPKGVGFLYISEKVRINPLILGGGQQKGMRSGTDNVPGIAGLGAAAQKVYGQLEANRAHLYGLKRYFAEQLQSLDEVIIHGMPVDEGAPQIINAAFLGIGSEVLLHTLEDRGIYISAGSACSTHKRSKSPTLTAIHAPKETLDCSVRFSFAEDNTKEQIDYTMTVLREVLPVLRRYRAH